MYLLIIIYFSLISVPVVGEVCVWSIASDTDQLVAHSGLCHNGHHEPVSRVTWIEDTQLKKQQFNVRKLCLYSLGHIQRH